MAQLGGVTIVPDPGLAYKGIVTAVPGTDQFTISSLAGLGAGKFDGPTNPYLAFVQRKSTGTGLAPQGEINLITAYNTVTGTFTAPGFTVPVAVGDEIMTLHPSIAATNAILAAISALSIGEGLFYYGKVSLGAAGPAIFTIATLAGLGANKFIPGPGAGATGYYAFILRRGSGAADAPQGEMQAIQSYTTATGQFTTNAFTNAVAVGDEILILHPTLAETIANNTELQTSLVAAGGGSVATLTRVGLLIRWIADILNDATNGLANVHTILTDIKGHADKLGGVGPTGGSTSAAWHTAGGLQVVSIGGAGVSYKVQYVMINISALHAGSNITLMMFASINGVPQQIFPPKSGTTFTVGTDSPGQALINGTFAINNALVVKAYSDNAGGDDTGLAIGWEYFVEAM